VDLLLQKLGLELPKKDHLSSFSLELMEGLV
jgi:hypothetical protein